jgi:hypothetical protein
MSGVLPSRDELHGPTVSVAVLCRECRREPGGNVSIIGVLEGIEVPRATIMLNATVVVIVHAGGLRGAYTVEVAVKDPTGYAATDIFSAIVTFARDDSSELFARELSIRLSDAGVYWLEVALADRLVARQPMTVVFRP